LVLPLYKLSMKKIKTSQSVKGFIDFFRGKLEIIRSGDFPGDSQEKVLFQKILYLTMIDTLSNVVYPQKRNRDRVVSFIQEFSDWRYRDRVSLPHLIRILEEAPGHEFSELQKFAFSCFDEWTKLKDDKIDLSRDPSYELVQKLWPKYRNKLKPIKIEGFSIKPEFIRHDHLFYAYRNSLVHELRELGYGIEGGPSEEDNDEPFYHYMKHDSGDSWELVYPLGFFESMCKAVLEKLEDYCIKNRVDPYHSFTFGTYWIRELNR